MNFLGYVLGFIIWIGFSAVVAFGTAITVGYESANGFKWLLGGTFAGCMILGVYLWACAYWQNYDPKGYMKKD